MSAYIFFKPHCASFITLTRAAKGHHFSRQNATISLQMKALRALFRCLRRDMVPDAVLHD